MEIKNNIYQQLQYNKKKNTINNQTFKPSFKCINKSMKNDIKIIFSDIDGTISEHSDLLTSNTLKAMELLHQKKIPVVLTTARCYEDTTPIINQFKHKPDYTIVLQGGGLTNKSGNFIFDNKISKKSAKKLINWFNSTNKNDKNSHLIMYFDEQPYSTSNIQFPWKAKTLIKQIKSFDELFKENKSLQKAVIYKSDVKDCPNYNQKSIIDSFRNSKNPDLNINPSSANVLEFQNKWVTKDKAIDFLLRVLKIEPKNAMVIGDSSNDIEMMDFIKERNGLAVAMGNANEKVKEHANTITSSVQNDGFYNIVEKLFGKKE